MRKEYLLLDKVEGPLILLSGVEDVSYGEIIDITMEDGQSRKGKVIKIEQDKAVAQVFEGTSGMSTHNVSVQFTGKPFEFLSQKES